MDGETAFSPVRPLASGSPNVSSLKPEERATPSPKRLPPHLRLRLMRQQEEAAAALAQEVQKKKTAACQSSFPSPSPAKDVPSNESTWDTTRSPLWTPVPPAETCTASSSSASSSGSTPDGGASIVQHREDGRLTPPVFLPVQENTVNKRGTTKSVTEETMTECTMTVDCHPNAGAQQSPLQPLTNIQLQTPPPPQKSHNTNVIKREDSVGKEDVHPANTTVIPPNCALVDNHNQANQPANTLEEDVGDCATSNASSSSAVNVWDTDASEKNSPQQSIKDVKDPSKISKTEERQSAHISTPPEDHTGDKKGVLEDEGNNIHNEQFPLEQVQNKEHTQHDSGKVSDSLPVLSNGKAESTKATSIPDSMPAPLATQQDAVLLETGPEVAPTQEHKPEQKSVSSIATNENVNFTGEDIVVVHAFPRPRQYPKPPENVKVTRHPDPLRAHPVDIADVTEGTPAAPTAVAAQEDSTAEGLLDMTRDSLTTIWVHRMRRYRTTDVVGGRTQALRDESQVHHDFYGYPLPFPSPTTAGASAKSNKNAGGPGGPGGPGDTVEFVGMAGANAIRDASDRHLAEDDPMKYPPTEPTAPLYRLRMVILCNFAARCLEAKHRVEVIPQPENTRLDAKKKDMIEGNRRNRATNQEEAFTTESAKTTKTGMCPLCAPAHTFTMREQHGQLFLESVLLPLSETATYADMVLHVNTSVAERIFADVGMGNARADDPAYPWEDIQTMPVYEDYQGALVLATHRRRVMEDLPMTVDDTGMIKGLK